MDRINAHGAKQKPKSRHGKPFDNGLFRKINRHHQAEEDQ